MAVFETSGFIDAHSHLRASSLSSQGIGQCENLEEALVRFSAMTVVEPYDEALVACSELILGGVTGVQFMFHVFGDKERYQSQLEEVLRGVSDSGIRALAILGVTDEAEYLPTSFSGQSPLPQWTEPARGLSGAELGEIYRWAKVRYPGLEFGIGPVGPQWCSDGLMEELGELAQEGMRIHSHLLESPRQRHWGSENPLERLDRFGLLGPKTSLAHCVWCNDRELKTMAEKGAQPVTCPGSNRILGAGTANLEAWKQSGVELGFGLDSSAEEIKPFEIAQLAMDRGDALTALTSGGQACTDLATHRDTVKWADEELTSPLQVWINDEELVSDGRLKDSERYQAAKGRVLQALSQDRANREGRIAEVDRAMPNYQRALDSCLG